MPTFVDYAGMNTLILSTGSFDENNIIESQVNPEFTLTNSEDKLVGINIHRNGPYGYSTWRQLRVSENPITRHHRKTNKLTFVIQPGPEINLISNGELRVRSRYSSMYSFTEPAISQKSYPLVWNVGRHFRDEDGNISLNQFSILSSYGNSKISFANEEVREALKVKNDGENTEYPVIAKMYLDNGLEDQKSPLTYWEFLQYRETVYPKQEHQFLNDYRGRPQFDSFYRYSRILRTREKSESDLGFAPKEPAGMIQYSINLRESTWPLDEHESFLTRDFFEVSSSVDWQNYTYSLSKRSNGVSSNTSVGRFGEGLLMNSYGQYWHELASNLPISSNFSTINQNFGVGPLYTRRTSLNSTSSVVAPTGIPIPQTASLSSGIRTFQGGALWEAGDRRKVRDENNIYVSASRQPFFDTYENHTSDIRLVGKNYSVLPEFRISTQVKDILQSGESFLDEDLFEVVGGISGSSDSSMTDFYKIYSNTDFMKEFEILESDHQSFTSEKVLSLRCKVIKKLVPYDGFYPCQATANLAKEFYNSYADKIDININTGNTDSLSFLKQSLLTPLFAPGVLFNTIKSGIAVDYPIIFSGLLSTGSSGFGEHVILQDFDKRIPFEALIEPEKYLANIEIANNEPHPSGNLSASIIWNGDGSELYRMQANNFLAEVPEFFLPNRSLTSIVSKKQRDGFLLESGSVYGMRIRMRRSMNQALNSVYNYNSSSNRYFVPQDIPGNNLRETFTMYSRPSSFGPPTQGQTFIFHSNSSAADTPFSQFSTQGLHVHTTASTTAGFRQDSIDGYNFPFTPPYYHGEAWCDITITGSGQKMTIKEIQNTSSYLYSRLDSSPWESYIRTGQSLASFGPQGYNKLNKNAVQLSSSLNIKGFGKVSSIATGASAGSFQTAVVDSALDEDARWVIQTKFETPMLNFNDVDLSLPEWSPETVPRGMWHQYGLIPEDNEGIFLSVEPIPDSYQINSMKLPSATIKDLSSELGFSGITTKLGRIANSKMISEAVVAVPFLEISGKRKFFKIDKQKAEMFKSGELESLTSGSPDSQIGRSVLLQMEKMKKFVIPPSFDFINYDNVEPIAMYIFEFSHRLSQQDLSDIWQNIPPDISVTPEMDEVAITHPLLAKELLGKGGEMGNSTADLPNNLRWMVFKAKQRAASSYFKKTVSRNTDVNSEVDSSNVSVDEYGATNKVQFNWPYDYFSLVELAKIESEVEFGNTDFKNYVDSIPEWEGQSASIEKIDHIVQGIVDGILVDPDVGSHGTSFDVENVADSLSFAGTNAAGGYSGGRRVGMSTDITAMNQLAGGAGGFQNLASSTLAQQQEDALRAKYLQNAKSWVQDFNYAKGQGYPDSSANGRANRSAYSNSSEFAIEFNLTNIVGDAQRTEQNIKYELMEFFRIAGS